ncbi:DUF5615 family PIN-like protein [Nocardioides sp. CFH 31398]|uniref:DUF5615 family PIN-like protein n=1 Tax=Nocardioides sp. CFH 31398 TaxID=2919579 RepID=UPI001F061C9D|nr:DUF5615 family PIN-like protein [Nocardioides sp. CFH 31398]MCH1867007.1 DUF5615 family PIN-like protein [Nocardioides sp. CFH 31398]
MRFFLDQNVDARLRGKLVNAGHVAWTADDAGLSAESDPDLSIYAHDRSAVLVTHDREFSQRVRKRVVGHHIWLHCDELEGPALMTHHLEDAVLILQRHPDLFIEMTVSQFTVIHPSQDL